MDGNISLLRVLPLFLSPLSACFVRIWNECNTKGFKPGHGLVSCIANCLILPQTYLLFQDGFRCPYLDLINKNPYTNLPLEQLRPYRMTQRMEMEQLNLQISVFLPFS